MNFHDSSVSRGCSRPKALPASADSDADVFVLNTCSVGTARKRSVLAPGRDPAPDRGARTSPTIAVTGCVAQQEGLALLRRSTIDVVVGTQLSASSIADRRVEEPIVPRSTPIP
jgi:tRNA A37 methylthiotransferase MiaB